MPNAGRWPELSYEEHPWTVSTAYGTSRTALRRHAGPYRAAVVPAISNLRLDLDPETNLAAEDALQELVRFDSEAYSGRELGPLAAVLLRTESASSSQIENLTSGARQIATASLGEPATHNAELIAANTRAMEAAVALSGNLTADSIITMQQALLGPAATVGWRQEQVWIGGSGIGPHEAQFVPPHHERVPAGMADLEEFMFRTDLPVVQQAAISHAQFETIHPFPDGNGRTGRALLHALLRSKGAIRNVTVPVSAGLLVDTPRYFAALDAYRTGDPNQIVVVLSDAVFAATANARQLRGDLASTLDGWRERLLARADSVAWPLLLALPNQPVINTEFVAHTFKVSKVAAQRAIDQLVASGILREFTGKKRARLWLAGEITGHLDAFAARTGRRSVGD